MSPSRERPPGLDSPLTARIIERAALWPRLLETYADFETYQTWTDREIPVIVLSPRP